MILLNSFVDELLPYKERQKFIAPICRAYNIAEQVLMIDDLKNEPIVKNVLPNLKNVIVEYELKRVIDKGLIDGVSCRYSDNIKHTHPFIEILADGWHMTVSQVSKYNVIPRNAKFRNNRANANQLSLFKEENENNQQLYALLTHGYHSVSPNFICLGIPDYKMRSWEDQINLIKEPKLVVKDNSIDTLRQVEEIHTLTSEIINNSKQKGLLVSLTDYAQLLKKKSEKEDE